jgi:predicted HicB family RNase H-like nuclease
MVKEILHYKGYKTTVRYSVEDKLYWGKIEGIRDLVLYESKKRSKVQDAFQKAVDEYLELLSKYDWS